MSKDTQKTNKTDSNPTEQPDPVYLELEVKHLSLCNKQIEADIRVKEKGMEKEKRLAICDRIENARRNVEVLHKCSRLYEDSGSPFKKDFEDTMKLNLKILKETDKIK